MRNLPSCPVHVRMLRLWSPGCVVQKIHSHAFTALSRRRSTRAGRRPVELDTGDRFELAEDLVVRERQSVNQGVEGSWGDRMSFLRAHNRVRDVLHRVAFLADPANCLDPVGLATCRPCARPADVLPSAALRMVAASAFTS